MSHISRLQSREGLIDHSRLFSDRGENSRLWLVNCLATLRLATNEERRCARRRRHRVYVVVHKIQDEERKEKREREPRMCIRACIYIDIAPKFSFHRDIGFFRANPSRPLARALSLLYYPSTPPSVRSLRRPRRGPLYQTKQSRTRAATAPTCDC